MTEEKKQQLFPYFAYMYSQQLDPEKYGSVSSIDEWSNLIQDNQNDMNQITNAASQLSDEEWDDLEKEYSTESSAVSDQNVNQDAAYAKKGAKLKKLKDHAEMMKKGGKKKKCECGCEVVTKKENGGQLVDACSCCGKVHNNIVKAQRGTYFTNPGQTPYEVNPMIPKHSFITPDELTSQLGSLKPIKPQRSGLTIAKVQDRIAPQPNTNGNLPSNFIGSAAHPKALHEATTTAKDLSKKKVTQAPAAKTTTTTPNRISSTNSNKVQASVRQAVIDWQKKLAAEGFDLGKTGVDGKWGQKTENAYKAYLEHKKTLDRVGLASQDKGIQDNAPFVEPRQGFDPNANNYYNAASFKKGGVMKKQSGGDATSSKSQIGVAKDGTKIKSNNSAQIPSSSLKVGDYNTLGKQLGTSSKVASSEKELKDRVAKAKLTKKAQGGTVKKSVPKANIDSTKIYRNEALTAGQNIGKDPNASAKMTSSLSNMNRQTNKNKPGFNANGFPVKKETGGKAPIPSKNLPLKKSSLKKEEKRNAEISKPDRIGKAKVVKKVKTKKC